MGDGTGVLLSKSWFWGICLKDILKFEWSPFVPIFVRYDSDSYHLLLLHLIFKLFYLLISSSLNVIFYHSLFSSHQHALGLLSFIANTSHVLFRSSVIQANIKILFSCTVIIEHHLIILRNRLNISRNKRVMNLYWFSLYIPKIIQIDAPNFK